MDNLVKKQYTFGMIGLGTMGSNLLMNIAEKGFSGAGYDKNTEKVAVVDKLSPGNVQGFSNIQDFVQSLQVPRAIMMLVPAGKIVDDVIAELTPLLDKGDIIIDGGNSYFTDTEKRSAALHAQGFHFFGMGISGGEDGARYGPSMMPGGDKVAYKHVQNIFEAISAKVGNDSCVTYIGPGAAGHFVKMVHNGIEYALMQLIAETYGMLKNRLNLDNSKIHEVFSNWSKGRLQSFLLEITAEIFAFKNEGQDFLLIDHIKDQAKSKGTGKWTSQIAMDNNVPIPVIDTAVSMRDLSKYKSLRTTASQLYTDPSGKRIENIDETLENLEHAFFCSMVITYAQGMHMLYIASINYKYDLQLNEIAKIWRGGCIIRSAFLEDIYAAYTKNPMLEHLLLDETICAKVNESMQEMRTIVADCVTEGTAIPAYASALSYFDTFRSENMPSNLIQAQRDFFGAHTYELIGKEGTFHTNWNSNVKA